MYVCIQCMFIVVTELLIFGECEWNFLIGFYNSKNTAKQLIEMFDFPKLVPLCACNYCMYLVYDLLQCFGQLDRVATTVCVCVATTVTKLCPRTKLRRRRLLGLVMSQSRVCWLATSQYLFNQSLNINYIVALYSNRLVSVQFIGSAIEPPILT